MIVFQFVTKEGHVSAIVIHPESPVPYTVFQLGGFKIEYTSIQPPGKDEPEDKKDKPPNYGLTITTPSGKPYFFPHFPREVSMFEKPLIQMAVTEEKNGKRNEQSLAFHFRLFDGEKTQFVTVHESTRPDPFNPGNCIISTTKEEKKILPGKQFIDEKKCIYGRIYFPKMEMGEDSASKSDK